MVPTPRVFLTQTQEWASIVWKPDFKVYLDDEKVPDGYYAVFRSQMHATKYVVPILSGGTMVGGNWRNLKLRFGLPPDDLVYDNIYKYTNNQANDRFDKNCIALPDDHDVVDAPKQGRIERRLDHITDLNPYGELHTCESSKNTVGWSKEYIINRALMSQEERQQAWLKKKGY